MAAPPTLKTLGRKLRIIKPASPGKNAVSTKAYTTTRVTSLENGIHLNRQDGGIIQYTEISLLVTFQLDSDPDTWHVDLFVYGQPGSFRLSQKVINYRQFLPEISQRSKDNFYAFLLYLIDRTDSVYVDESTLNFLKTKKIASFPDFSLFEDYTTQLWFQVLSWMKFQCDQCSEIYWVDDAKVTEQGAKTKCVKCQNVITVKKRERPVPLKSKEKQTKIPCPHCQYENPVGQQFCVMCQKPLIAITPPQKTPSQKPSSTEQMPSEPPTEERSAQETATTKESISSPDISSLPLQARQSKRPRRLSFREIAESLQDDIKTMHNKFAWFTHFSLITQILGFLFFIGGILAGFYFFSDPDLASKAKWFRIGLSVGAGFLLSLACTIVSNIIALTLQIEQNTKVTSLLLQKLVEKEEE